MSNLAREAAIRDKIASQLSNAEYCKTEYRIPLNSTGGGRRRNRSMDVFVQHESIKYIIEVKHAPKYTQAIGQLIAYRALHCQDCRLVIVLYGTPAEIAEYKPECQKVLTSLEVSNNLKMVLMSELG
jgi:hypothetical protein